MHRLKLLDVGSYATVVTTLVLFVAALFVTGLTHDLLLEAGVFLVSVKLIIMGHKSEKADDELRSELRSIRRILEKRPLAGA